MKKKAGPVTFIDLVTASREALEGFMKAGVMPDMEEMAGYEFRGYNTLDLTAFLGFRKFMKGFVKKMHRGKEARMFGYNVKVVQNGLADPWEAVKKGGHPVRHGFFEVYPVRSTERDNFYPSSLLLNYGKGKNPMYDPSCLLRDYLVQVSPGNPHLLLGKAFLAFGRWRQFVSYFVLERYKQAE